MTSGLPFHCQFSEMSSKTISHNWMVLLCGHTDTSSPATEFPANDEKIT